MLSGNGEEEGKKIRILQALWIYFVCQAIKYYSTELKLFGMFYSQQNSTRTSIS